MKYKRNCKTCQMSKGNEKLRERILHAKFRRQPGDETQSQIAADLGISQAAFLNHTKKHINEQSVIVAETRHVKQIEKIKAKEMKDVELSFDHSELIAELDFERGLREVVAEGITRLEKGEIQVSTTQLLQAIKIKADYSAKKRGQDTELIKTMYRMASQNKEQNDPDRITEESGEVDQGGTGRSSDLHHETPWDALARRAEALSQADPST